MIYLKLKTITKLWLFLMFLPLMTYSQTTIIVVRTSYGIFIGSDTKRGISKYDAESNSMISQVSDTVCKIHKFNDVYYAIAGGNPEPLIGEIEKSISLNENFENILIDSKNMILSQRINFLKDLQINHQSIFESRFDDLSSLEVAIFGFEKNIPKTGRIVISITSQKSEPVQIKDTIVNKNSEPPSFENEFIPFAMGHTKEIKDLMFSTEFWLNKHPAKGIEDLIMIETEAHPESVSAPIDLLLITQKGPQWIQGPVKPQF